MQRLGILLLVVAIAFGCDSPVEPSLAERRFAELLEAPAWSLPSTRVEAFADEYSFAGEALLFNAQLRVARDSVRWASVWDSLTATVTPKPPPPVVAFAEEMPIVVFAGVGALGHITIEHVTRVRDTTFVLAIRHEPGRYCGTQETLSAPTAATIVPLAPPPTLLISVTRVHHCDD